MKRIRVGYWDSPCPRVRCETCDRLQVDYRGAFCPIRRHFIHMPDEKRSCCRYLTKGQKTLEGEDVKVDVH